MYGIGGGANDLIPPRPAQPTIFPVANQWSDSVNDTVVTVNGTNYHRVNTGGSLRLQTSAGCSLLAVVQMSNFHNTGYDTDASTGVYIDGAYFTSFIPTVWNAPQTFYIPLYDTKPHLVELVGAAQIRDINNAGYAYVQAACIYSVTSYGGAVCVLPNPSVTRRLVCYGDSITSGIDSTPTAQYGWVWGLRKTFDGRISVESFGGRGIWDDTGATGYNGFASLSLLTTRLISLLFDATIRQIWINLGINDYFVNRLSAANYGTTLGTLLDTIHTADSTVHIFLASITVTAVESTPNFFGNTPPQYRAAALSAASSRTSFCQYVDGLTLVDAGNLSSYGLDPNTVGHQQYATRAQAVLGS